MLDDLDNEVVEFVANYAGAAQFDLMKRVWAICESYNLEGWDDSYEQLMNTVNVRESVETLMSMFACATAQLTKILDYHRIQLTDDCPLHVMVSLCEGLSSLATCDMSEEICAICEDTDEPVGRFCEIMGLVSELREADMLTYISNVDEDLFVDIQETVTTNASHGPAEEPEVIHHEVVSRYVSSITALREAIKPLVSERMEFFLESGIPLGLEFETYLSLISADLNIDYKNATQVEYLCIDLLYCAFMSSNGNGNPVNVIEKNIETITDDVQKGLIVNLKIKNLMRKLQNGH